MADVKFGAKPRRGTGGFVRGRDHILVGALTGAALVGGLWVLHTGVTGGDVAAGAIASGVGALLPDLDHPKSKASNALPWKLIVEGLSFVIPVLGIVWFFARLGGPAAAGQLLGGVMPMLALVGKLLVLAVILLVSSGLIRQFTVHRGVTHSFAAAAMGTVAAAILCAALQVPIWYAVMVGIGWLSHLATDAPSRDGLPRLMWLLDGSGFASALTRSRPPQPRQQVRTVAAELPPRAPESAVREQTEIPLCPKCGVRMVRRVARKGSSAGQYFYGCANYPRCRQTKAL